ncbi:MAG TPA: hypothetical protein VIK91_05895, partial [Nannocystis sp.]
MMRKHTLCILTTAFFGVMGCSDDGGGSSGASQGGGDTSGGTIATTDTTGVTSGQPTPTTGGESGDMTTATTGTTAVEPTGTSSTSATGGTSETTGTTGEPVCGVCPIGFICKYEQCLPNLGSCVVYDDCPGDSYCDPDGQCIPYGVPEDVVNDPECVKPDVPEGVTPVLQCDWTGPTDPDDPTKNSTQIYTTPVIADLNLDLDPGKLQPSIIVTTFQGVGAERIGMLRVFDGRTCTEQMRAGGFDDPDM